MVDVVVVVVSLIVGNYALRPPIEYAYSVRDTRWFIEKYGGRILSTLGFIRPDPSQDRGMAACFQ